MSRKNTILASVLAVLLGWRGVESAIDIVREARQKSGDVRAALTLSESERITRELNRLEIQRGVSPPGEAALYAALARHLVPDATVFFVNENVTVRRLMAFQQMHVLFAPRPFFLTAGLPANWRQAMAAIGTRCYVIEHGTARKPELAEVCDRLAEGPGFVLWRYRGGK